MSEDSNPQGASGADNAQTPGDNTGVADTVGGGAEEAQNHVTPPDWPDDWRAKLAGDDKKFLKTLERYGSPNDFAKAHRSLTSKIDSGEFKTQLPKDATTEQVVEWRKSNGIPDSPEGYEIKLSQGMVLGESDQPLVDSFKKFAHERNLPANVVSESVDWFLKSRQAEALAVKESDIQNRDDFENELRTEWGAEFKKNINMVSALLDAAPEGVKDKLLGGRTAEGKLLGDDPDVLRFLNHLAREIDPAHTLVSASTPDKLRALEDEKASIEKRMGTVSYTEKDRARYAELVDIHEKVGKKSAA